MPISISSGCRSRSIANRPRCLFQVPLLESGKLQPSPHLAQNYLLPAHNGNRSRRRGKSCARVPGSISQEPARSGPSPGYHLINTPTLLYIFPNPCRSFLNRLGNPKSPVRQGPPQPIFREQDRYLDHPMVRPAAAFATHSPSLAHRASIRALVARSISIIAGQGRSKPSAFHLRVASMPIFDP